MIFIIGIFVSIMTFYFAPIEKINIQGAYEWSLSQYEKDGMNEIQFSETKGKLNIQSTPNEIFFKLQNLDYHLEFKFVRDDKFLTTNEEYKLEILEEHGDRGLHTYKLMEFIATAFTLAEIFEKDRQLNLLIKEMAIKKKRVVDRFKKSKKGEEVVFQIRKGNRLNGDNIKGNFKLIPDDKIFFESIFELFTITSCCQSETIGFMKIKKLK